MKTEVITEVTDGIKPFIGQNGVRASRRAFRTRANAVFADGDAPVMSDSPEYLSFMRALHKRLDDEYPPKIVDGFATENPITADFSALRTVSGYYSNPANIPPRDNTAELKEKGVNTEGFIDKEAELAAESVMELLLEERDDNVNVRVSKVSSSGMPYFSSDPDLKRALISFALERTDLIRELVLKDDMEGLARLHCWFAYTLQVRLQAEGGTKEEGGWRPKPRPVHDWKGRELIADKTSELSSLGIEGHWSSRVRTVFATSGLIGYLLTTLLTPRRTAALNRFSFSLHHTGAMDLYRKMVAYETVDVIGLDVKQMDQNYPAYFSDFANNYYGEYFDESVVKMMNWLTHAPFFSGSPGPGQPSGWRGNPMKVEDYNLNYGLPSGILDVSHKGKYWVLFSLAYDLQRVTGKMWKRGAEKSEIKRAIEQFMSGTHDFVSIFNTGDDTVLLLNKKSVKYKQVLFDFLDRKLDYKPAHALYVRDSSVSYLGLVFMKDATGEIIVPKPSANSYVLNPFAPERGVFDRQRSYWGGGMMERRKYYAAMGGLIEEIDRIIVEEWRKTMTGPTPFEMALSHARKRPFPAGGDQASVEVLEDPSKIHYKYLPTDVQAVVLDQISLSFTQAQLSNIYQTFERQ